jgi:Protein of unknown function (DUF2642)
MKYLTILLALTVGLASCTRTETYPLGTDVTVEKKDGGNVSGRLVEVKPDRIVVQGRDGMNTEVAKSQIASLKTMTLTAAPAPAPAAEAPPPAAAAAPPPAAVEPTPLAPEPAPAAAPKAKPTAGSKAAATKPKSAARPAEESPSTPAPGAAAAPHEVKEATPPPPPEPVFRELIIPAGTTLSATLGTSLASDTSKVEDPVRATLKSPISVEGFELLPAGAAIIGHVTSAQPSGRVKGRASIGFRFNTVNLHGAAEHISTETIVHEAAATKGKDATKIGVGAGVGAVIGGIAGGGDGAAKGAAIGGGAGTAAVLATKGDEIRLAAGTPLSIRLTAPLNIRVQVK